MISDEKIKTQDLFADSESDYQSDSWDDCFSEIENEADRKTQLDEWEAQNVIREKEAAIQRVLDSILAILNCPLEAGTYPFGTAKKLKAYLNAAEHKDAIGKAYTSKWFQTELIQALDQYPIDRSMYIVIWKSGRIGKQYFEQNKLTADPSQPLWDCTTFQKELKCRQNSAPDEALPKLSNIRVLFPLGFGLLYSLFSLHTRDLIAICMPFLVMLVHVFLQRFMRSKHIRSVYARCITMLILMAVSILFLFTASYDNVALEYLIVFFLYYLIIGACVIVCSLGSLATLGFRNPSSATNEKSSVNVPSSDITLLRKLRFTRRIMVIGTASLVLLFAAQILAPHNDSVQIILIFTLFLTLTFEMFFILIRLAFLRSMSALEKMYPNYSELIRDIPLDMTPLEGHHAHNIIGNIYCGTKACYIKGASVVFAYDSIRCIAIGVQKTYNNVVPCTAFHLKNGSTFQITLSEQDLMEMFYSYILPNNPNIRIFNFFKEGKMDRVVWKEYKAFVHRNRF